MFWTKKVLALKISYMPIAFAVVFFYFSCISQYHVVYSQKNMTFLMFNLLKYEKKIFLENYIFYFSKLNNILKKTVRSCYYCQNL